MLGRLDSDGWELYNVAADPAENRNVAGEHRDKLIELISLWYVQAGKYDVLPIDGSTLERMMVVRPEVAEARDHVHRSGPAPRRCRSSPAPRSSTGRTPSPPTRRSPPEARKASC